MNIYLRKDGRYESRIPNGKKSNGKRTFLYVLARTKEQCINRVQALCRRNKPQGYCSLTVTELFNEWHHSILHRVKESPAANYNMNANKHILPVSGGLPVGDITSDHIYEFISKKQQASFSLRYIADIVILMKSVFKYAVRTYQIANPLDGVVPPKKKQPEIQLLDETEQKVLQQYIGQHQNRSTLGIAIALTGGLRIGEICPLQWKDVDLEKRILTVSKTLQRIQCPTETARTKLIITEPKSESSRRTLPIPECMMNFLKKFRRNAEEYLISGSEKPTEPRTMQHRFSKILKNLNLPSVHFHSLRHLFATTCVKLGFDIKALSEILGHSSVKITLNRYVHSDFEQKRDYMKLLKLNF